MGREARARAAREQRYAQRPVFWAACPICGQEWPWPAAAANVRPEHQYRVCQVCLVQDLAQVQRECRERFKLLPSLRVKMGLPVVVER